MTAPLAICGGVLLALAALMILTIELGCVDKGE